MASDDVDIVGARSVKAKAFHLAPIYTAFGVQQSRRFVVSCLGWFEVCGAGDEMRFVITATPSVAFCVTSLN